MNHHIVKIYWHRWSDKITDEWIASRIAFCKAYTLKSLQAQSFKDFSLWFCCDPGMEEAMEPLRDVPGVFTFGEHYSQASSPKPQASDFIYVTRVDSDDLYRHDALEIFSRQPPSQSDGPEALMFQRGYLYDIETKRIGVYFKHSSPFHCVMWPTNMFLDPEQYRSHYCGDHSKVKGFYRTRMLDPWKICVLTHGGNYSSSFESLSQGYVCGFPFDMREFM